MVEFVTGKSEIIAWGKESTYGTPVTPTKRLARNVELLPNNEQDWQTVKGAGTSDEFNTYEKGNQFVRCTLRLVPNNWEFLTWVWGTTTNTGTDPYTHTFSTNTDKSLYSFTVERCRDLSTNFTTNYEGCQVNQCIISWAASESSGGRDSFVNVDLDVMAEDVKDDTVLTSLTAPSGAGFQARNVTLTVDGNAEAYIINGNITINNNLHTGRYAAYEATSGGALKKESRMQERIFSGEFVLHYTDSTWFDLWVARAVVGNTNTVVFTRGTNDTCTFTFTNLRIVSVDDPTNLDGVNQVTVNWIADNIAPVAVDSDNTYIT